MSTLMRNAIPAVVLASLLVGEARAVDPNPVLDHTNFDVIAFEDLFVTTWRYGDRTQLVAYMSGLQVTSTATTLPLVDVAEGARVLVNDGTPIGAGWPTPDARRIQSIAMTGLDLPLIDTPGVAVPLQVNVSPRRGRYPAPIRLRMEIIGGAGGGPKLEISDNGVALPDVLNPEATITLGVGTHLVSVRGSRGGVTTGWKTNEWTIDPPADTRADSDGDGVPDVIEAAAGMDALAADANLDVDHDGWTNLDEVLRGCPPGDIAAADVGNYPECTCVVTGATAACVPGDNDADGWSNWDETLRETDKNVADSRPAARTLYESETLLGFGEWLENGVRNNAYGIIQVVDVHGAALPVRFGALGDGIEELAINSLPRTEVSPPLEVLPLSLGVDYALRVPGDLPFVVRMQDGMFDGVTFSPQRLGLKLLVATGPAFAATSVLQALRDAGQTFTDLADFRAKTAAVLKAKLLLRKLAQVTPRTTTVAALFESLASWHAAADGARWLTLGPIPNADVGTLTPAVRALADRYATALRDGSGTTLDANTATGRLLDDLDAWLDDPSMAAWKAAANAVAISAVGSAQGWPADFAAASDLEIGRRLARTSDKIADIDRTARTGARLVAYLGRPTLAALTNGQRATLALVTGDYDNDGASQLVELAGPAARATNPLVGDTDGDGDPDATDPCGNDPFDACWPGLAGLGDGDGDGYADGIDNCPNVANGTVYDIDGRATDPAPQLDSDGNGVGDACQLIATISSPRTHMNIATGDRVTFAFLRNPAIAANDIAWTWHFDSAAPDSSAASPSVTFSAPGTYLVTLTATRISTGATQTDLRRIGVRGTVPVGPSVEITLPTSALEGVSLALSATASDPTATLSWTFGDGGSATGTAVTHTYAANGSYAVSVSASNANGTGTASGTVVVADSVPVPDAEWNPTGIDQELQFLDASASYDGVASVTWTVIAPAGVDVSGSGDVVTLTFPWAGVFSVRQRVTDTDGSVVDRTFEVDVEGSGIQLIEGSVTGAWTTFTFERAMIDPIVVAGIPTARDNGAGQVAIRNVTATGFQARYREWVYLNATHAAEAVPFLAIERGRHERADGTVWVADSLELAGPRINRSVVFEPRLPRRPTILATSATALDDKAFIIRVSDPTRRGFDLALYNEEARIDASHVAETIGWVAIASVRAGSVTVGGETVATLVFGARLQSAWRVRRGYSLMLDEEKSADAETHHAFEMGDMIVIDDQLFGSTVSLEELDPFSIRRR